MLRHVVLLSFAEQAEGAPKSENIAKVRTALAALPASIPEIRRLEIGMQALDDATASDLALIVDVADEAALRAYAAHPAHLAVVGLIKKVITARHVVDYFMES